MDDVRAHNANWPHPCASVCHFSVPALWRTWLNYRRDEPPTEKELEAYDDKQVLLASSAACRIGSMMR
jgi:NADH:ubiquinone oxidoreductase subunit